MTILVVLVVAFLLFLLLLGLVKQPQSPNTQSEAPKPVQGDELAVFPFEPMPLMTDTEVRFFQRLQQALPEYLIFSQVQLSRMIAPIDADDVDASFWFNRICRMSVDYVIVAPDSQTVLVAIELDDWTHQNQRRQQQDAKKDKAVSSAGIPMMRYHATGMPESHVLRAEILSVIG